MGRIRHIPIGDPSPRKMPPTVARLTRKLSGWLLFECPCGHAMTLPYQHKMFAHIHAHNAVFHP